MIDNSNHNQFNDMRFNYPTHNQDNQTHTQSQVQVQSPHHAGSESPVDQKQYEIFERSINKSVTPDDCIPSVLDLSCEIMSDPHFDCNDVELILPGTLPNVSSNQRRCSQTISFNSFNDLVNNNQSQCVCMGDYIEGKL